jgi:hypothetical protein
MAKGVDRETYPAIFVSCFLGAFDPRMALGGMVEEKESELLGAGCFGGFGLFVCKNSCGGHKG